MRLVALILPAMIGAIAAWFSQISAIEPGLLSLIGNGITVAVLAWYVIFDVKVRTPNMLGAFAKEQDELRKAFKDEQAGSRETFTKTIEACNTVFRNEQAVVRQENRDDRAIIRTRHTEEINQWRKMVNDMLTGMQTAVREVHDTAQMAISKDELKKEANK